MIFSKYSQRKQEPIKNPDRFNPAPGHYETTSKTIQEKQQLILQRPGDGYDKFSRDERFKHDCSIQEVGPGKYNQQDYWKNLQKQKNNNLQGNQQPSFKVNAIPSIPTSYNNEGYQEIGEGLLVLIKGNRNDENGKQIGPNQYVPNYSCGKQRSVTYSFGNPPLKSDKNQNSQQEQNAHIAILPKNMIEQLQEQPSSNNNREYEQINEDINKQIPAYKKSKVIKNLDQKSLLPNRQDYEQSLAVLIQREKAKRTNNQGPDFLNPDIISSFKNAQVRNGVGYVPGFMPQAERFKEDNITQENVGPGSYSLNYKINQKLHLGQFNQEKKFLDLVQDNINENIPPVGAYDPKNEKPKFKESNAKFQSVFGSGTQRFTDNFIQKQEKFTPGPANYNPLKSTFNKNKNKKPKLIYKESKEEFLHNLKLKRPKSHTLHTENQKNTLQQQNINKNRTFNQESNRIFIKKNSNMQSTAFASKTNRFEDRDLKLNPEKRFLGPGCYDQGEKGGMKGSSLGGAQSQAQRFVYKGRNTQSVGPGFYETQDDDAIRSKIWKANLVF